MEILILVSSIDDLVRLFDIIVVYLVLKIQDKQCILEIFDL